MITVAILTVSDSSRAGTRADLSGPALRQRCQELGWEVVRTEIVSDERSLISEQISQWADTYIASLILTTGGTGIAARDVTPEGTHCVLDRDIPGIPELLRSEGLEQTPFAPLSRGIAGTRKQSLIINLPGSPRGAVFSLTAIQHLIPHVIDLLNGRTDH